MLVELDTDASATLEGSLVPIGQNEQDEYSLEHHGIKGQRWGLRRYQNPDGSLTPDGRIRYGVGSKLRNAASKAGSAAGKAIRKAAGRQTDEELDEELAKAKAKHERQMKRDKIDELSGKRKRLSKMTDQEVDQYLNRLTKEKSIRNAEKELKDLNRSDAQKFLRGLKNSTYGAVSEGVKRGVANRIANSIEASGKRKQQLKQQEFDDEHKTESDRIKEKSQDSQNKLKNLENETKFKALSGDEGAQQQLRTYANAQKGKTSSDDGKDSSDDSQDSKKSSKGSSKKRSGKHFSENVNPSTPASVATQQPVKPQTRQLLLTAGSDPVPKN